VKGRLLGVLALAAIGALGIAAPWAMSSDKRSSDTTTVTSTVTTTTTQTVFVGASSSSSSSSSSSGGSTGSTGQQQQQQQGSPDTVIVTVAVPVPVNVTVPTTVTVGTVTVPTTVFVTTNVFTPPASVLVVTRGGTTVQRTSTGWTVTLTWAANRAVVAKACVMTGGVCVTSYRAISVPKGSAAIALAVPASVGAGSHTVRVIFRSGTAARILFYPVILP